MGEGGSEPRGRDAGPRVRPSAPEWKPHFELASPGWRASSEPLCPQRFGDVRSRGVWTNGDHVFGLVATQCNVLAGVACGGEGVALYENQGEGWRLLYETTSTNGVRGITLLIPISATAWFGRSPGGREVSQAARAPREPSYEDLADEDYA